MPQYYVDPTGVNGTGSSGSPFNTLTNAVAVAIANDTIFLRNTERRTSNFTLPAGVSLRQWAGQAQGEVTLNSDAITGWTSDSVTVPATTVYKKTITGVTPAQIAGVNVNWETNIDEYGRRFGQLKNLYNPPLAYGTFTLGDLATNTGAYYLQASGSDTIIWIRLQGDANPSTKTIRYTRKDHVIYCSGNNIIDGLIFGPSPDLTAAGGYSVNFGGTGNNKVSRCLFYDAGYHSIGSNGGSPDNNVVEDCVCYGLANSAGTPTVVNGDTGSLTGHRFRNVVAFVYGLLHEDKTQVYTIAPNGFYHHTNSGGTIDDLEYTNCVCIAFPPSVATAFNGVNQSAAPTRNNPNTYPVRVIDAYVLNCGTGLSDISYQRLYLDFRTFATSRGIGSGNVAVFDQPATSRFGYVGDSVIITDLDYTSGSNRIFNIKGDIEVINSTIIDLDDASNGGYNFIVWPTGGPERCYFYSNVIYKLAGTQGFNMGTARVTAAGNLWPTAAITWFSAADILTVDTTGVKRQPYFLTLSSPYMLWAPTITTTQRTTTGINGRSNINGIGAYQMGPAVNRLIPNVSPFFKVVHGGQ